jgi:DNA-binding transcriptional LysR family regulator
MPSVVDAELIAGDGERLARRRAGPDFAVVGPARHAASKRPPTKTSEKVTLVVPDEIVRRDFFDAAFIHVPVRDQLRALEVAEPLSGERFVLVVVTRHAMLPKRKDPGDHL